MRSVSWFYSFSDKHDAFPQQKMSDYRVVTGADILFTELTSPFSKSNYFNLEPWWIVFAKFWSNLLKVEPETRRPQEGVDVRSPWPWLSDWMLVLLSFQLHVITEKGKKGGYKESNDMKNRSTGNMCWKSSFLLRCLMRNADKAALFISLGASS